MGDDDIKAKTRIFAETITLVEKSPSLYAMYQDISELVKREHPEIYKTYEDAGYIGEYETGHENLVNAYKSVLHTMLLDKIPGFRNDAGGSFMLLRSLLEKYNVSADFKKTNEIRDKIQGIIDLHCGASYSKFELGR